MLIGIERVLLKERPQAVIVYGDTNSTLAGALAASKLHILLAHVEAGLRSFNMRMPEEINRIITDSISDVLFCPTRVAVSNLRRERRKQSIYLVGDVMYDSLKRYQRVLDNKRQLRSEYLLCTIHRAESTNCAKRLKSIFKTLGLVKEKIIIPLHPRTAELLRAYRIKIADNIRIIMPISYREMLRLEKHAKLIITDSGGVQKEAFMFSVPCVTLREETEWIETVGNKMNIIAGYSQNRILSAVNKMLKVKKKINPERFYGDGFAHKRIVDILLRKIRE
jgi:UDP-GlcNAc3NAcA epimerase